MVAGQEKNGTFYMVLNYSAPDGKRKSKWISTKLPVKGNKKRAEQLLTETRRSFMPPELSNTSTVSADMLFTDFMKLWLAIAKTTVKLTTYASYAAITNNIIIPYFEPTNSLSRFAAYMRFITFTKWYSNETNSRMVRTQ